MNKNLLTQVCETKGLFNLTMHVRAATWARDWAADYRRSRSPIARAAARRNAADARMYWSAYWKETFQSYVDSGEIAPLHVWRESHPKA